MRDNNPHVVDNTWEPRNTNSSIKKTVPGEYVMGDLSIIGWVVIRRYVVDDENKLGWQTEFKKVFNKNLNFWTSIQSRGTKNSSCEGSHAMQVDSLKRKLDDLDTVRGSSEDKILEDSCSCQAVNYTELRLKT